MSNPESPVLRAEFEEVTRPVMKWLNENCHPHHKVVIGPDTAELLEGKVCTGRITDYIKD